MSLYPCERETHLCLDDESKVWRVNTTRLTHILRFEANPLFVKRRDIFQGGKKIGVEGYLPKRALTIRRALGRGGKATELSEEEKESMRAVLSDAQKESI